jgi:hypothetical protein
MTAMQSHSNCFITSRYLALSVFPQEDKNKIYMSLL